MFKPYCYEEENHIPVSIWKQVCGRFNRPIGRLGSSVGKGIVINKIGRLELYGKAQVISGTTTSQGGTLKIRDADGRIATLSLTVTYTGKEE